MTDSQGDKAVVSMLEEMGCAVDPTGAGIEITGPQPPGFLKGLRGLADDHGLVLVFDEVQGGVGRTTNHRVRAIRLTDVARATPGTLVPRWARVLGRPTDRPR